MIFLGVKKYQHISLSQNNVFPPKFYQKYTWKHYANVQLDIFFI